jgi:hypothetical protein
MGFKLSVGLGIALVLLAGSFKMYYDKSQAELDAFQIRLERSIQNQKLLESTIEEQNDYRKKTWKRKTRSQISEKSSHGTPWMCCP